MGRGNGQPTLSSNFFYNVVGNGPFHPSGDGLPRPGPGQRLPSGAPTRANCFSSTFVVPGGIERAQIRQAYALGVPGIASGKTRFRSGRAGVSTVECG